MCFAGGDRRALRAIVLYQSFFRAIGEVHEADRQVDRSVVVARPVGQDAPEALKPAAQRFPVVALTTDRVGAENAVVDIWRD